jgi:hypothetical protein
MKKLKLDFKISNEQLVQYIITLKIEKQQTNNILQNDIEIQEIQENYENTQNTTKNNLFINLTDRIIFQITTIALLDSGADMNCIQE